MDAQEKATNPFCNPAAGSRTEPPNLPRNRRAHPRYAVDEVSTLLLVSHGLSLQSHILDLSLEGCRLCLLEPYTVGAGTRVEVAFKVNGIAFRFVGVIQWTDQNHLLGIHFVDILARRKELLAEVVCEMQRMAEARAAEDLAAKELAERAAAESHTLEDSKSEAQNETRNRDHQQPEMFAPAHAGDLAQRVASEWVEIQQIARKAKAAHQKALQLHVQATEKSDRRAQARHPVDTTATVLLVKSGSKLRGHILDLSMSGCGIRSDERFPVGIYTRVEAEFRLEGLPFLLAGVIQAIHDPHNVGIRFLDMSPRKREQVEQLIAEIAKAENANLEQLHPGSAASQEGIEESRN